MEELVIDVSKSGSIENLHDDRFPLKDLEIGDVSMERASIIEWSEMDQYWVIKLPNSNTESCLMGFTSYESARKLEILWLNECRKQNVEPSSEEGIKIAVNCRHINKIR